MTKNIDLKTTFNQAAWLYDKARPHYPDVLFQTLIDMARLENDARLLEIGPGTGQATRPFAQRGFAIVAVELGQELAEVARQNLGGYSNVEVVTAAFEDAVLPPAAFDLVYSATAFHWIKSEVQFTKPHHLLKASGHLAIIHTHHVSDEAGDDIYWRTKPIYNKFFPSDPEDGAFSPPRLADIQPPVFDTTLFELIDFELFPLTVTYTAEEYTALISTFSPTLALPQAERLMFLNEIQSVVNQNLGGNVRKIYAMSLALAKKV